MIRRLSSPVFVGRRPELERLAAAFRRATEGRATVVVVAGEAGVGKSRLIEEASAQAAAAGARVLVGRCVELGDVGLPFAPLVDALRQLAAGTSPGDLDRLLGPSRRELARLVPALGAAPRDAGSGLDKTTAVQAALFEHVVAVLGRLAADRPLELVFEDLHWADGSTRDLVRYLARSMRGEPVVLVLTYRSDDLHRRHPLLPLVADLDRLGMERLMLQPFVAAEVAAQVEGILGRPAEREIAERLCARSDGNAFFVEELLAAGVGEPDPRLPEAVADVVATRVSRLRPETQEMLRVGAVIGRQVDHATLARLAGMDEPALLAALREAVDDQLLVAVDDAGGAGYEFRHALVQETLADQLLPTERIALHRGVARLIEADGPAGHEAELAHHWYRAHALPEALAASVRAAQAAAAVGAFTEARAHGERALELWPEVPDAEARAGVDHPALLVLVADSTASTGALARAFSVIDRAVAELLAAGEQQRVVDALHRSVWFRWDQGDAAGAERAAREAIAHGGPDVGPAVRARLLSDLAYVQWESRCYVDQLRSARRALRFADASGDRVECARARLVLGLGLGELARPGEGLAWITEACELLGAGPADVRASAGVGWTHVLDLAGRTAECVEVAEVELARVREAGLFGRYGPQLLANLTDALFDRGEYDALDAILARHRDGQEATRAAIWLDQTAAELAVVRGETASADAILEARSAEAASMSDTDSLWMEYASAGVAHAAGRLDEARRLLDRAVARSRHPAHDLVLRYPLERAMRLEADIAVAAAARGDVDALAEARRRCATAGDTFLRLLDRADPRGWEAPIASFRAGIIAVQSRADGRPDPDAWAAMAVAAHAAERPHDEAFARVHEAEAAMDTGRDPARVAAAIDAARSLAAAIGAVALGREIDALARRAGIRVPRPNAAASRPGLAGLSARELEVLAEVAEGLTNREIGARLFISEKTASVHVTHILDKLGVGSRTEAALAAERLGLLDGRAAARAD